ncbi:hypothetical protein Pelo_18929 [Pelomyxa schiedti]|nr:hypothetical protein Pelo_18929 [Pelomyxa schiedti]
MVLYNCTSLFPLAISFIHTWELMWEENTVPHAHYYHSTLADMARCTVTQLHCEHIGNKPVAHKWLTILKRPLIPPLDETSWVCATGQDRAETAAKSTTASPNDVSRRTPHHRTRKVARS